MTLNLSERMVYTPVRRAGLELPLLVSVVVMNPCTFIPSCAWPASDVVGASQSVECS